MNKTIKIKKDELEKINKILQMTPEEIYLEYKLKRDDVIKYIVNFGGGIEVDIKVVICEEEKPYVEGVLFVNGYEMTHTEPSDDILGEWLFEVDAVEYNVNIEEE